MNVSAGRIVHYVPHAGSCWVAVVTFVDEGDWVDQDSNVVSQREVAALHIMPPMRDAMNRMASEDGTGDRVGTWHWPCNIHREEQRR